MCKNIFRGKRLDNGEWVSSGNIIHADDNGEHSYYIPVLNDKFGTVEDEYGNILSIKYGTFYKVAPATVGQYTGLTDKNGKRIFEGDLVKYHDRIFGDVVAEIIYSKHGACFCARCVKRRNNQPALDIVMNESEIEVIGNIHDNPELLEQ